MAEEEFSQEGVILDSYYDQVRASLGGRLTEGGSDGTLQDGDFSGRALGERLELEGNGLRFDERRVFRKDVGDGELDTEAMAKVARVFQAAERIGTQIGGVEEMQTAVASPFANLVRTGDGQDWNHGLSQDSFRGRS